MRIAGVTLSSMLIPLLPLAASASELPARKPGLWEVKTSIGGNARALTVQQCIDAATDQMLQSNAGPFAASSCPEREVKKSDASIVIDSRCTIRGKPASAHAVITGSFENAYTMTVNSEGGELPAASMTVEGKWLGACVADQQPGDVMMAGGVKINVPQMQKRTGAPDTPAQPTR
jgi:hypothetical protein